MKESRISLLLLISLSLLLLAIVVLFIGGLAFYKQSIEVADHNKPSVKTAVTRRATNTDSLQAVYNSSIVKLNTELDSTRNQVDSFQQKMDSRLNEFNSLKNEIAGILQKNPASSPDILVARQKIVILQPDGKVMKRSSWESGSFDTKDGRKVYSQKLTLDFNKTESKHLNFSIAADEYQKGSYVFQLYHNGKIIASTSKRLS